MAEPSRLPEGYSLDLRRGEPDLLILTRLDGSSVVALEISGLGPDPDRIMQIAADDAEVSERSAAEDPDTQDIIEELSEAKLRERMRDKAHLEEVGRRAWQIYEQSLSYELEPERVGEFLVLDTESGDYEVDPDNILAGDRLAERQPNAERQFLMGVGYSAAYGIGARPKRLRREPGEIFANLVD